MVVNIILANFIRSVLVNEAIFNQDIIDQIDTDNDLSAAISSLLPLIVNQHLNSFLSNMKMKIDNDTDGLLAEDVVANGTILELDFSSDPLKKKNRAFAFADLNFTYLSTKYLNENNSVTNIFDKDHAILLKTILDFLSNCYTNNTQQNVTEFIELIKNNNTSKGYIIDKNNAGISSERLYSYIYLKYLNDGNSIRISQSVSYVNPVLHNGLTISNGVEYEQFLEIYDVVNELNLAKDILGRFLKVYHILEYLAYRVYLVDLVQKVGSNKIFVREFIKTSKSMDSGESDSFRKNFIKIFAGTSTTNFNALLTQPVVDFLKEKKLCPGAMVGRITLENLASAIYQIRCGIVHNKESEYHFTITNPEEYNVIIPFMVELIKWLEKIVIVNITNNNLSVKYTQRTLNIY